MIEQIHTVSESENTTATVWSTSSGRTFKVVLILPRASFMLGQIEKQRLQRELFWRVPCCLRSKSDLLANICEQ